MSTATERQVISDILRPLRSPCIVDLGAHQGEDSDWMAAACGEKAHVVMVEPDPRNIQIILDRAPTSRTRRLIVGAVGASNGWHEFNFSYNHKTGDFGSGSIRTPTGHLGMDWIKFGNVGIVMSYTLDTIFEREWLTKIDMLWVDIQGAENLMIQAGQTALTHTRYLFVEVEEVELYGGQSLEAELYRMLPGWELVRRFEQNALLRNPNFVERGPR